MTKPVSGLNVFQNQAGPIPLSQLDANFTSVTNSLNDFATYSNYVVDSSGAANTITVTVAAPLAFAYVTGIALQVRLANTNTSATVNINVNSLGNRTVINNDGTNPAIGSLTANSILDLMFDGTSFRLLKQSGTTFIGTGLFSDGTAPAPSISFASDTDTGLYRISANRIGIATAGVRSAFFDGTPFFQSDGPIYTSDGTVALPGLSFSQDTDTGIFRAAANDMRFSSGGVTTALTTASGFNVLFLDGSAGSPSINFFSDTDTGIYRVGANALGIAIGGVQSAQFNAAQFFLNDGVVANPAFSFLNDTDTGIFRAGANAVNMALGGSTTIEFRTTGTYFTDGSAGSPAISFIQDPDTGIYRNAANDMRFSAGGNLGMLCVSAGAAVLFQDGSAAAPQLTFQSDQDTGIYGNALNTIQFSTGGSNAALIGAATIDFAAKITLFTIRGIGTTASAANAFIDNAANNSLLRSTSSIRYKANVNDVTDEDIERLLALRPVTYTSLCAADDKDQIHFGLIAEEVNDLYPQLVHRNEMGEPEGVQYDRLVPVILAYLRKMNRTQVNT